MDNQQGQLFDTKQIKALNDYQDVTQEVGGIV